MRKVCSSAMAALVVVALFWGNCFSCPQVLLALAAHQPAHQCCHRTTKPATPDCSTHALQHFVTADPAKQTPPAPVVAALAQPVAPVPVVRCADLMPSQAEHTPPDRIALNSVFRI